MAPGAKVQDRKSDIAVVDTRVKIVKIRNHLRSWVHACTHVIAHACIHACENACRRGRAGALHACSHVIRVLHAFSHVIRSACVFTRDPPFLPPSLPFTLPLGVESRITCGLCTVDSALLLSEARIRKIFTSKTNTNSMWDGNYTIHPKIAIEVGEWLGTSWETGWGCVEL